MGVNNNNITIRPPSVNCGGVCEKILRALPDWFGIEESLIQYVKDANTMPTIIVKDDDDVVRFLTIKNIFQKLLKFIVWVYFLNTIERELGNY